MLFSESGGITYHMRALRHKDTLWLSYRTEVADFLNNWQTKSSTLLLIGPSAGYSLPTEFLRRFDEIFAVDPDRLAPYFFKKNHRKLNVHWRQQDYFKDKKKQFNLEGLQDLLSEYKDSAVLFCNMWGQFPLIYPDFRIIAESKDLSQLLAGREWASYHDKLSAPMVPTGDIKELDGSKEPASNEKLAGYYAKYPMGPLSEHATERLFQAGEFNYFWWQVRPGFFHIIEAVHN
jgi:hypothetical protein